MRIALAGCGALLGADLDHLPPAVHPAVGAGLM
jgi:hypothetical protein